MNDWAKVFAPLEELVTRFKRLGKDYSASELEAVLAYLRESGLVELLEAGQAMREAIVWEDEMNPLFEVHMLNDAGANYAQALSNGDAIVIGEAIKRCVEALRAWDAAKAKLLEKAVSRG